jgi:hypothetical protein
MHSEPAMMLTKRPLPTDVKVNLTGKVADVGLAKLRTQVLMGVDGIRKRMAGMSTKTDIRAHTGEMKFRPESQSFALDTLNDGSTYLVNYVVRSGTTYTIPLRISGDAAFMAYGVRLIAWQRFVNTAINAEAQMIVVPNVIPPSVPWTTKFSCYPTVNTAVEVEKQPLTPCLNYRWNIQDPITGSLYSDNLIPGAAMMQRRAYTPSTFSFGQSDIPITISLTDGATHTFPCAFPFLAGQMVNFYFRPVTDIVQYDSSVDLSNLGLNLLPYDDRQNGRRDQTVTVQVELYGEEIR